MNIDEIKADSTGLISLKSMQRKKHTAAKFRMYAYYNIFLFSCKAKVKNKQ